MVHNSSISSMLSMRYQAFYIVLYVLYFGVERRASWAMSRCHPPSPPFRMLVSPTMFFAVLRAIH